MQTQLLLAVVLLGLGALGLGLLIARSIIKPIVIIAGALANFGQGDLNRDLPASTKAWVVARPARRDWHGRSWPERVRGLHAIDG